MSNWIELDSLIQHYKELRDTIVETDEFGLHPVPIENMIGLLRTYQGTPLPDIIRCRDCIHSYRIDGVKEEYDCAKISAFAKFFPGDHFCGYGERKTDG